MQRLHSDSLLGIVVDALKKEVDANSNKKIITDERVKHYTIKVKCSQRLEE